MDDDWTRFLKWSDSLTSTFRTSILQQIRVKIVLESKRLCPWLPFSPDVDIKYVGGADPVMILLDAENEEVEVYISYVTLLSS